MSCGISGKSRINIKETLLNIKEGQKNEHRGGRDICRYQIISGVSGVPPGLFGAELKKRQREKSRVG